MDNNEAERRICELLTSRPDDVVELALAARKTVRKAAGKCCELVYSTYAVSSVHSFTGKLGQAFIHIAVYAGHVNLGFNHGTKLEDEDGLLVGTGKLIRHVRLESKSDLRKPAIKKLIANAVQQGRHLAADKAADEVIIKFV